MLSKDRYLCLPALHYIYHNPVLVKFLVLYPKFGKTHFYTKQVTDFIKKNKTYFLYYKTEKPLIVWLMQRFLSLL
ncbi:MAG: hypothetical protein DRG39_03840 [Deltaproteobacteria bacterium]|nr:MAG: hypothetical protein DRG39_03840 [Deltaproteobacteria bacterium]